MSRSTARPSLFEASVTGIHASAWEGAIVELLRAKRHKLTPHVAEQILQILVNL